jgi:hypothetical protein
MIVDAFTFLNEKELVELRIKYLNELVDCFLIVEADVTHTGKEKKWNFSELLNNNLKEFSHKIQYHQMKVDLKKAEAEKKMTTWRRDQHGNFIFRGAFKISPLAAIVLIAFIAIAVLFAVAVLTNTEESGECANPFCHMFGIEDDDPDRYKFAPPTSELSEERELP